MENKSQFLLVAAVILVWGLAFSGLYGRTVEVQEGGRSKKNIQQIARQALQNTRQTVVVIVDVQTGEVVALAASPEIDALKMAGSPESPGSVFLPVVAMAALEQGAVTPEEKIDCGSGIQLKNHFLKCWKYPETHGSLALSDAMAQSCGGYFYRIADRAGPKSLSEMSKKLGLGRGSKGIIPDPQWLSENDPETKWNEGHTANMAVGQGYVKVSPLQMTMMTAALVNGGIVYGSQYSGKSRSKNSEVLWKAEFKPENVDAIKKAMKAVVEIGTGMAARQAKFEFGGKTGSTSFSGKTPEGKSVREYRNWFISFAPYDHPRYALCIMSEMKGSGGALCAPIAGEIWHQIFSHQKSAKG